jgi:hypothetical protein
VNPPEPGWYRDPYFKNRERYWDGEIWSDECRLIQPALSSGTSDGTSGAGAGTAGRHRRAEGPDPVTAQQPTVSKDPIVMPPPATPPPSDTQPIRIYSGGVAGAGAASILGGKVAEPASGSAAGGAAGTTADPPTKADAAASAERVRKDGAAAILGGAVGTTTDGAPPPTRSVKSPKEPPAQATRRVSQEADPLLGVSMPGTNSAVTAKVVSEQEASKSHRRGLIIAVAAVVVVLAGLGAYLAFGSNSTKGGKGNGKSATAAAAAATLHQKTAHVAIDVKLSTAALGQTDGPSAVGDFDLTKSQGTLTLTVPSLPPPGTTPMIFEKGTVYINLGSGLSATLPGKTWLSADVLQVSSSSAIGGSLSGFEQTVGNPAGLLRQLKGNSSTVVSLGHSTFDGTPVRGYTVTLSSKALTHSAELVPASHTTETVYVASSSGLVTAIVIPSTMSVDGQLVNQNTYIVFSNFGAPVTVTTPPPSDVATLAEYQAAVANKPTTPTTAPASTGAPSPSTSAPGLTAIPGTMPTTTTPAASGSPTGASSPGLG